MEESQIPIKTGLLEFFKRSVGSQFVIPVYQRNYTWTINKEVKQYMEDLKNILEKKYSKHFLGILIYLDTSIDFKTREFSVIDGQQRLTTTFLLLYVIKHLMIEKGMNDDAQTLEAQYLTNQFVDDKMKYKLKPLVSDDEVYRQIVNNQIEEITNKTSNVYKNYMWLKDTIDKWLCNYSFNEIIMAIDKLYVVCVPVNKSDSPQKIFESINSTGAKLSSSDLIRNYILMDIESDTQEKYYANYWKKIEEYISNDSKKLELFFRMFLACKMQNLINLNAIYPVFKEWYVEELENNNTESILKEIVKYSRYYYYIYNNNIDLLNGNSKLNKALLEFRNNLSEMPAPFLMEMYALYESRGEEGELLITEEQLAEIIEVVNTYLIRRAICGLDTSDITRLFPTLLKDVLDDCKNDFSRIVEYVKKNLINKQRGKSSFMPDNDFMKSYLEYANVYNLRLTLRIILDKIETYDNSAPVDLKKLSVEHLMPQKPTKEWLDELQIDEITYEKNLNRLGNLTLATKVDNSKMKNNPWDYKKSILEETSHLTINKKILEKEKWTIKEINERNEELINQIIELYPYYSASDEVIVKHMISIEAEGVNANAFLFEEDGSVEIQEGTEMLKYDSSEAVEEWQLELYNELLEEGVIKENESKAIFVKPYLFTSTKRNNTGLSASAYFILKYSRSGWDSWKDENGEPLNNNIELKKKLTQR